MTEVSAVINETHLEQQNFEEIYIHGLDAKRGKNYFIFKRFDKIEPITGIVNLYHLMHISIPIIQKLQERALDVIKAFAKVNTGIVDLEHLRDSTEHGLATIYK